MDSHVVADVPRRKQKAPRALRSLTGHPTLAHTCNHPNCTHTGNSPLTLCASLDMQVDYRALSLVLQEIRKRPLVQPRSADYYDAFYLMTHVVFVLNAYNGCQKCASRTKKPPADICSKGPQIGPIFHSATAGPVQKTLRSWSMTAAVVLQEWKNRLLVSMDCRSLFDKICNQHAS